MRFLQIRIHFPLLYHDVKVAGGGTEQTPHLSRCAWYVTYNNSLNF